MKFIAGSAVRFRASVAGVFLLGLTCLGVVAGPTQPNFPALQLPGVLGGDQAVRALGDRLPQLAQAYGMEAFALRLLLLSDSTLAVDRTGRLRYAEPGMGKAPGPRGASEGGAAPLAPLAPLSDTFRLHSRPSAKRIIYLDFDGHVLTGTAWNSGTADPIVAPAWDTDGDPSTFSDSERTVIQNIWQRVAEDYAPFDVDVTTELTSEDQLTRTDGNDEYYGDRALISPISSYFGNYGGYSYLGVFDSQSEFYKTALIFPENLGPNSEAYIAEAISHEVGHSFNLIHDGTSTVEYYSGQGSWAPIMGVGYYKTVVQWSKGEYSGANNLEDDLSTIAGYVGYRADDHGNTAATATVLPTGSSLSASGVITGATDVDVFSFATGAGAVSISLSPDSRSPNLNVSAELRGSAGNLIATNNPTGVMGASFSLNLAAGTYYIHVRGAGEGSASSTGYSAYGSVGQYRLTGTVVQPSFQPPVAAVSAVPSQALPGQAITFSGTGSYDPDGGPIAAHAWSFSDGATDSGATVSKSFATSGTYTATLTVTDDEGVTASKTVSVVINLPPTGVVVVNPSPSSYTQTPLTFDGAGSVDPDGTIASYSWSFGDGTTGTGPTVAKAFSAPGTYPVQLTLKDNLGAVTTQTVNVVVTRNPTTVARVQSFVLVTQSAGGTSDVAVATVQVTDLNGAPVAGVVVAGKWSGLYAKTVTVTTGATGTAVFTTGKIRKSGTESFTVTGLTKAGYFYDSTQNSLTSGSVLVP